MLCSYGTVLAFFLLGLVEYRGSLFHRFCRMLFHLQRRRAFDCAKKQTKNRGFYWKCFFPSDSGNLVFTWEWGCGIIDINEMEGNKNGKLQRTESFRRDSESDWPDGIYRDDRDTGKSDPGDDGGTRDHCQGAHRDRQDLRIWRADHREDRHAGKPGAGGHPLPDPGALHPDHRRAAAARLFPAGDQGRGGLWRTADRPADQSAQARCADRSRNPGPDAWPPQPQNDQSF